MSRGMDLTAVAKALQVPALVLGGSRGHITPPALSAELHTLIADSRLKIVESAGHMVLIEAPHVVNREIQTFADALAGSRRLTPVERGLGLSWPRWILRRLGVLLRMFDAPR